MSDLDGMKDIMEEVFRSGTLCLMSDIWRKYLEKLLNVCGSNDNSLEEVELSGHETCNLLSSHPFKQFPRRVSGPESVCSG